MREVIVFAVLGLGSAGVYALGALGVVLVYRTSNVVNFANGAIGMVGTYVFWELADNRNWPVPVALVVGIAVSALVGALVGRMIVQRLRGSSQLTRVIATLAVLAILQAAASLRYPQAALVVNSFLPTGAWTLFGGRFGQDRIIIFLIAVALAVGLYLVYRFTAFGRWTSAVAENEKAAASFGISPDFVSTLNWAIAGALAGLAGMLIAPIIGLGVTALTLLIVPSLAAAVVGKMSSFPLTLLAAVVIGVAQAELTQYVSTPGWSDAVPFILLAIVLLVRGRVVQPRGESTHRLPSVGSGRIRPAVVIPILAVTLVLVLFVLPVDWVTAVYIQATIAILIVSQIVITGYAGQISLAQYTFAGIGALVAAHLVAVNHVSLVLALPIAMLATIPCAAIVGFAGTRTRGVNLAILTLALSAAVYSVVLTSPTYAGGADGFTVGSLKLFGLDVNTITEPGRYAALVILLLALVSILVANLRRGRVGRRLLAVRENERAAAALGISVTGAKVYAFVVSGVIAAIGGVLLVFTEPNIVLGNYFSPNANVLGLEYAVVGGIAWMAGAPLGASLASGALGAQILSELGSGLNKYLYLIGGVSLLLVILANPDGMAAESYKIGVRLLGRLFRRRPGYPERGLTKVEVPTSTTVAVAPKVLDVRSVTVRYGGVTALDDVSLTVNVGEIVGLIGPNGAGKTTLIDALTGFARPSAGEMLLGSENLHARSRERRARAGLGRTFQSLELFDGLTVLENIRAGSDPRDGLAYLRDFAPRREDALSSAARAGISKLNLAGDLHRTPSDLPYGERRLVAIARAVAAAPSVLLLDEPAAGLSDIESGALGEVIRMLAAEWKMGILLVEHDVDLVMSVADRVYVLNYGRCIASGRPAEVRANKAVVEAYLGESVEELSQDGSEGRQTVRQ